MSWLLMVASLMISVPIQPAKAARAIALADQRRVPLASRLLYVVGGVLTVSKTATYGMKLLEISTWVAQYVGYRQHPRSSPLSALISQFAPTQ
jgi:hypothetical protein